MALVAAVAILVRRFALGAGSFHEPVRQEGAGLGVVELRHLALADQAGGAQRFPEHAAQLAVGRAVRAAVVIELDVKAGEIAHVGRPHVGDNGLFAAPLLASPDHDGRAVRIVGADIDDAMPAQPLKAHPNVGLDVLDQVAQMDVAVGVGECAGDENFSHGL